MDKQPLLVISDLHVSIGDKPILKGLSLSVKAGEVHAIMGPNGAGKSTLAKILAGHPSYEIVSGEIWFKGKNLLDLEVEERVHLGLFMSFQYPLEIEGVSNLEFLFASLNAQKKGRGEPLISRCEFDAILQAKMEEMDISPAFKERNINEGFSGGEKKKNEILQMALFAPDFAILDETDSGLDIDAIRVVARGVNQMKSPKRALVLITHYQRLLDYITPDFVHVLIDGKIQQTGTAELALQLEEKGYA